MKPPFCTALVLSALACAAGGCAMFNGQTPDVTNRLDSSPGNAPQAPAAAPQTAAQKPAPAGPAPKWPSAGEASNVSSARTANGPGSARAAASDPADPQALANVLAEVAAMGALEPKAQQQLIADLRTTDPAMWPGMIETFRATLAYRRRAAERAKTTATPTADPLAELTGGESTKPAETPEESGGDRSLATAFDAAPVPASRANASPDGGTDTVAPTLRGGEAVAVGDHDPRHGVPGLPPSAPPSSPIQQASHQSSSNTPSAAWQQQLAPAIADLEKQTRTAPNDADAVARHVWLRMLYLAAGRRDDALKPIPGIAPAQQDYWSKQIFALATYLDSQRVGDPGLRAAEAVQHLTRAAGSLAEQAPLVVRNLTFCTAVESYGVHKQMEQHEFKPDQELLVYAEVENFKSEETEKGFHTALQPSYQILDSQGRRVHHDELPLTEEYCHHRRRDYFVRYFIRLPKDIYDGAYKLEWTIEDTLAHKIGQSTIDFTIKKKK